MKVLTRELRTLVELSKENRCCLALQPDKVFDPEIMEPIQNSMSVAKHAIAFR